MINNEFYDHLGDGWIDRSDHPVALLRRENAVRTPWVIKEVGQRIVRKATILDVGCGAGLLLTPSQTLGTSSRGSIFPNRA